MNLTEMLLNQNGGKAVDQLSREFGLDHQQTIDAIEALMPAFSHGLKRNVATPQGAASLIEALAGGGHGRYIESPSFAISASGIEDGNAILGHLFGNKDVSRQVAQHASSQTGIGASLLKKMLPAIASMVLGALFRGATSGRGGNTLGRTLGEAAGGGLLGSLIEGIAGGVLSGGKQATRRRSPRRRSRNGGLEDLLGDMLGGSTTRRRRPTRSTPSRRSPAPSGGGILGDLLGQMMGGGARQQNPYAQPKRKQPKVKPRRQPRRRGPESIFGDLLESGGNTSPQYRRETGDVFDQLLGN